MTNIPVVTAPKPEGSGFKLCDAGQHIAIVYQMIDLGSHLEKDPKSGQEKMKRKLMVFFELHGDDAPQVDGKPQTFNKEFAFSLHTKAPLRQIYQAATGKTITDEFGDGVNVFESFSKPFHMQLAAAKTSSGKDKRDVTSTMALMKGITAPTMVNNVVWFSLMPDLFDAATLEALPDWIKNKIKSSKEYGELSNGAVIEAAMKKTVISTDAPFDDDVAF